MVMVNQREPEHSILKLSARIYWKIKKKKKKKKLLCTILTKSKKKNSKSSKFLKSIFMIFQDLRMSLIIILTVVQLNTLVPMYIMLQNIPNVLCVPV